VDAFAGGRNGSLGSYSIREDVDVQLLWQLDNLGFGNRARSRLRASEQRAATLELFRTQDRVAAEVTQAYAQVQQAERRVSLGEAEVSLAKESYDKNLEGLAQTRRVGNVVQTIIRPQEVLVAVQALAQAYVDYFQAVADFNRAQFRLYRALGQPAQLLAK
jgi:outer membrane protein TolC